jgi:hypothetical protein
VWQPQGTIGAAPSAAFADPGDGRRQKQIFKLKGKVSETFTES